ncbi:GspE/PulE family protein [Marinobacter nauticus]|uniref:Type II secretion system protein E n=1 Tax=Marinobacter nauticus (strain ATCC 700491 / DSM 11845 / VT8) TaxID=351348 RepID=A1U404_MARN8|nr:ATPase, T2SS/T4P/T4SS family [Marinobacter nauticus]ABM19723.1 type II secretion system protein E [Marinobacter nauticus VT8]
MAVSQPWKPLGAWLVELGAVSQKELNQALEVQKQIGGLLGTLLVRSGATSEDVVLQALSAQWAYPLLGKQQPAPDDFQVYETLRELPVSMEWMLEQDTVAWFEEALSESADQPEQRTVCILSSSFQNDEIREVLETSLESRGFRLKWVLASTYEIERLVGFVRQELAVTRLFSDTGSQSLLELAEEAPVVELVNNVLAKAVEAGASDVHIEPGEEFFIIRYRVDGVLHSQMTQSASRFPAVASRIKLISGMDIAESRLPQDGRISTRLGGQEMDIRVSTAPCSFGESVVMRLLPKNRESLSLESLGMEPDHLKLMRSVLGFSNGIVLVTGPTGSGKSTTLYSGLSELVDGRQKLITVEDPVEFQVRGVTQIQANGDIGYTFARALRAILRQDPDIIMIGEIRDLETAEIAIQSALTGHLVLSTLHTNDALSAFTRLVDMGVEPYLVAAPVKAVQAQRLVRRACPNCSEPASPPESLWKPLAGDWIKNPAFVEPKGCERCHGTGYRGRLGIYEIIPATEELQTLVADNADISDLRLWAARHGHRNLLQDGLIKAARGETTIEEVMRVAGTSVAEDEASEA